MLERACAWVALSKNLSQSSTCVLDDKGTAGNVLVCSHTPASVSGVKDRHLGQLQEIERPAREDTSSISKREAFQRPLLRRHHGPPLGERAPFPILGHKLHFRRCRCGKQSCCPNALGKISIQAAWSYALGLAQMYAVWQDCVAIRATALILQLRHCTCWHTVLQLGRCEGHSG